jgi:hypothetical protein
MAIDGTYQGKASSPFGSTDCTLTLKANGATLTGHASAMGIESDVKNGTVNGDSFACQVEGTGPLGHMVLDIQGVVEGDKISGTVKAGRMKARFEGARV